MSGCSHAKWGRNGEPVINHEEAKELAATKAQESRRGRNAGNDLRELMRRVSEEARSDIAEAVANFVADAPDPCNSSLVVESQTQNRGPYEGLEPVKTGHCF